MSILGIATLGIAAVLGIYAIAGFAIGARYRYAELIVSARWALYFATASILISVAVLVLAFVTHQFQIAYIFNHSNTTMSTALVWVAFYAGNEGSLLFIAGALSIMTVLTIRFLPRKMAPAQPYVAIILALLLVFYCFVLLFFANPFALLDVPVAPTEGRGINPLLRHPAMFVHPPLLMAGLVGIGVPFALINGAILARMKNDAWIDITRIWGIAIWGTLGIGMLLGAWWAYTILGWGGYWSWDPIENVALMPWLVMTAFIHSIMVQKRRGMFRSWNIALVGIAFVTAQLGTSINRGGPVVSVHSFAASTLGNLFLIFMVFSLVFTVALFLYYWLNDKDNRKLESLISRETAILVNTFMMLVAMVVILWGVIYPVFTNISSEVEISIAAPYFNRIVGPIFLFTLFAMGIGPLLPWRKTPRQFLRRWLIVPTLSAVLVAAILLAVGISSPWPILIYAILQFSLIAVLIEWWRGTRARMRAGMRPWSAWWHMVATNRPRHGGYIVHISILIFAIGVTGTQFFDIRTDISLQEGESVVLSDYRFEYVSRSTAQFPDRFEQWANIDIYEVSEGSYEGQRAMAEEVGTNGFLVEPADYVATEQRISQIEPWQGLFFDYNQVSVMSGIHSNVSRDLYVVPRDFTPDDRVVLGVSINPLAMWLWIAGPIFILGTVVALWPSRKENVFDDL